MPVEWVIAALVTAITVLSTVVGVLWRNHLASDQRERDRADQANTRLSDMVEVLKKASRR